MELKLIITSRQENITVQNHVETSLLPIPNRAIHYNLHGTKIFGITLDWWPWNKFDNCYNDYHDCKMSGIMSSILGALEKMYNFTMRYDKETSGKWGSQPINGTFYDKDAKFEGVFNAIINGSYDISPTSWNPNEERTLWFDFTQSFQQRKFSLIFNLGQKNLYWLLFFAPLRPSSWIVMIIAILAIFTSRFSIKIFKKTYPKYQSGTALNIINLTGWICFLFMHAIYGGKLTTDLAAPPKIPFKTLDEGMLLFPKWSLCILKGDDGFIKKYVDRGLPGYSEFWEALQSSNRDEYTCNGIEESLKCIRDKAGCFLYVEEFKVALYVQDHNEFASYISFAPVETKKSVGTSLMLAKGSPYTRIFNK